MIVICEECGKKYKIDPTKIKDPEATATCTSCHHKFKLLQSHNEPEAHSEEPDPGMTSTAGLSDGNMESSVPAESEGHTTETNISVSKADSRNKRFMGLRSKILMLFFIVPIALIIAAGYLFTRQLDRLSTIISGESTSVVESLAQDIIINRGRDVANEIKLYLDTHPGLKAENFSNDPQFMKIAVQTVGKTGYTVLDIAPEGTEPWRVGAHPRQDLIGKAILQAVKERTSDTDFQIFKKMHDDAYRTQGEITGYYRFLDDKEKFQAMVPIKGTNLWVVSTTYLDEFTQPMQRLGRKVDAITSGTLKIVSLIIGATALIVALIALFYGSRLSNRIRSLTSIADRISVGDMDVEIETTDKDELGDLAQAIARMQDSIRLSIERLRRRRNRQAA